MKQAVNLLTFSLFCHAVDDFRQESMLSALTLHRPITLIFFSFFDLIFSILFPV